MTRPWGGGGHTHEILKKGGIVLGIDTDEEALQEVSNKLTTFINESQLILGKGNFRNIRDIAKQNRFENIQGVLFDFGVSSHQLDDPKRGFSFMHEGPLDMRMGTELGVTASDLVNVLGKKELYELFTRLGEERFAYKIVLNILERRKEKPIQTTRELATLIEETIGNREKIHPATRVFQALRIAVNDELHTIEEALPEAFDLLEKKGRLVVISFHSLEDRIVKDYFKNIEQKKMGIVLTKKPIVASEEEIARNPRARSAKLRVVEKI